MYVNTDSTTYMSKQQTGISNTLYPLLRDVGAARQKVEERKRGGKVHIRVQAKLPGQEKFVAAPVRAMEGADRHGQGLISPQRATIQRILKAF